MGVRRMRKGWLVTLCVVVSVAVVGLAFCALLQLLRGLLSSPALRHALEALWRDPNAPAALCAALLL